MALFKIEKGLAENLSKNRPNTTEGYCYVTTDDGKFYIDIQNGTNTSESKEHRIVLNAGVADKLNIGTIGSLSQPVYFENGIPVSCGTLKLNAAGDSSTPVYINSDGIAVVCTDLNIKDYLPLTAGEDKKLIGPLGLTENINYGAELPENGFEGQLFFLEDDGVSLPLGGTQGQVLIKNSAEDGDAFWGEIVALPIGGSANQILTKNSSTNGDATWKSASWLPLSGGTVTGALEISKTTASTSTTTGALTVAGGVGVAGNIYGNKIYGAVWNDYAEYRQTIGRIEPGRCVVELGDGSLGVSYKRLEPAPEIVSDTFGFAIGETNACKTPIAVAGRVLAYPYEAKEEYAVGDPVCSGPMGTISKMTREEVCMYPDRMIGTVSEIPDYETWGQDNIKVNGRIWIRIR